MFEARATEAELIDDSRVDPRLAAECYRCMAFVNRYAGGIRVVRRFIRNMARERGGGVLRVLDIGSGACDIPIAVSRWARARGIRVQFTCVDPSGSAARLAAERLAGADVPDVHLLQEDVLKHQPPEPYDCATASMCLHHFRDDDILDLLRKIRPFVRDAVLINDLRRSPAAWLAGQVLAVGLSAGARHDCLLSIRRGFKVTGLESLLRQLDDCTVSVTPEPIFRIAAVIRFAASRAYRHP